jgi:glyoxylase-like metal-dependent hydrolase (beta-lactamase superfamily II)
MSESPTNLSFPFSEPPAFGAAVLVSSGIWWVRMPLPFQLNHINLWLLDDGDGWVIVDTGLATEETIALWQEIFRSTLASKPIKRLIVTHFHPDHFGLAGWIAEKFHPEILMSATEWSIGQLLSRGPSSESSARTDAYDKACGYSESATALIPDRDKYHRRVGAPPRDFTPLREGDELKIGARSWRVIIGRGHSPEHVCLFSASDNILIAGDQVLARVSPNISVWPADPLANPLAEFFSSLERLRALPASTLVLPSHAEPFYGLHARLDELATHHRGRLQRARLACTEPRTVKDIVPALFGHNLGPDQILFAVGETLAHLNFLVESGDLRREPIDSIWYFTRPK